MFKLRVVNLASQHVNEVTASDKQALRDHLYCSAMRVGMEVISAPGNPSVGDVCRDGEPVWGWYITKDPF